MTQKLLLLSLLIVLCLSQSHMRGRQQKQGGFIQKTKQQVLQIQSNPNDQENRMYFEAKQLAKKEWEDHTGKKLGKLKTFSEQIVSGVMFRFKFFVQDNIDQVVQIGVWSQPWTSTLRVMTVEPPVLTWTEEDGTIKLQP